MGRLWGGHRPLPLIKHAPGIRWGLFWHATHLPALRILPIADKGLLTSVVSCVAAFDACNIMQAAAVAEPADLQLQALAVSMNSP